MSFRIVSSFFYHTDGGLLHKLKEELVADGWSVARSGSGSGGAFNNAGDVHAPGAAYGGTLDLANAWFELRAPATMTQRRSLLFQRPNTTYAVWRVWYSSDGTGFTGGAPSATARPTAADEQEVINGTAGSQQWFAGATAAHKIDIIIGDAAEQHSFFIGFREMGEYIYRGGLALDVLQSAHALDQDPAVMIRMFAASSNKGTSNEYFRSENTSFFTTSAFGPTSGMGGVGWFKKNLSGATWVSYIPNLQGLSIGFGSYNDLSSGRYIGQNNNGRTPRWPNVIYARGSGFTTQKGYKGRSRLLKYEVLSPMGVRLTDDRSRLVVGAYSLPWDGASSWTA